MKIKMARFKVPPCCLRVMHKQRLRYVWSDGRENINCFILSTNRYQRFLNFNEAAVIRKFCCIIEISLTDKVCTSALNCVKHRSSLDEIYHFQHTANFFSSGSTVSLLYHFQTEIKWPSFHWQLDFHTYRLFYFDSYFNRSKLLPTVWR